MRISLLVLFLVLPYLALGDKCSSMETCSACIRTPNCIWCKKIGNFTSATHSFLRCTERTSVAEESEWWSACGFDADGQSNVVQPENKLEITQDIKLAEAGEMRSSFQHGSSQENQLIQMRPQRCNMKLRIRESQRTTLTFRQAEDYPVDLYYLMDLSQSMADDKASLSALGQQLAEEMQAITRNFRLGFGSFVDKVVMPYVSTVPSKLREPCIGCAEPYGFRNALRLSTDASHFVAKVQAAPVSGNLDAPEGGFDAIMQAIKCKEDIGWRDNARHLLLFTTDAGFHYAGDGKLGGIVKPNDGKCHLNAAGEYTYSTKQDYPSVSQINKVVKEENINVIFAVTSEQSSVYEKLANMIEGSSSGTLAQNSSNIVKLVKAEYNKITSKVQLKDNARYPVTIRYFANCTNGIETEQNFCDGLRVGDEVQFKIEVEVAECPKDPKDWKQTIEISPVALPDKLIIELEMLCQCGCEDLGDKGYIPNAPGCNYQGDNKCGVCSCFEGYRGKKCECSPETPFGAGIGDTSSCKPDSFSVKECSGQGSCICGECKCNERDNFEEIISGAFCECTNFLCDHYNGEICSGPDHGTCVCNTCMCKAGWTGDACQCRNSTKNCVNPENGQICSNQGSCECNECKCFDSDGGRYSGKYCEDCPTCKAKCAVYKSCVQCQAFGTGEYSVPEDCLDNCTLFNATKVTVANVEDEEKESLCVFYDDEDCRFKFVYGYDENREPFVRVQRTLECPPKLDILGIVLGVIAAIVGVGLLLLIMWKFLTSIHDRREYARFEKERMMAKWDTGENPIYQQATSTFKNPLYGK